MGRPVNIRASYNGDAAFLLRLEAAIRKDEGQPEDWRERAAGLTHQLASVLLEAGARAPRPGEARKKR
jgi:hypothetical protein